MSADKHINVLGAGLAGSEAAWQIARRGIPVHLYEMKPAKRSPAHKADGFAELICSNSLRSDDVTSAVGLLKEELRRLGSLIMEAADKTRVPAGAALAVDRDKFSAYVTERLKAHPLVTVIEEEVTKLPENEITVVATGPLTSDALADEIAALVGGDELHFFDAVAPIVSFESVDMSRAFFASRWGKGDADYINCPMEKDEYEAFLDALLHAETAPLHDIDDDGKIQIFEGCMPVEIMAARGEDTLRYGPLKPVGITHPETGKRYYAVVQLRRENDEGTMYNLVGFQTHLTFPEQRRVFRMIPGLESADFLRYGVMHRNTFLHSPALLDRDYKLRRRQNLYFAGQMTGVEGYIESAASGFVAGEAAACRLLGREAPDYTDETEIGAMASYVSRGGLGDFQPMNANFGIIASPDTKIRGGKKPRYEFYAKRALEKIDAIVAEREKG